MLITYWTTIVAPLIVGVILIVITKLFSKNGSESGGSNNTNITMNQIKIYNINNSRNYNSRPRRRNTKSETDLIMGLVLFGGLFFDKAVPYMVAGILSITFLILGIFVYTTLYSYRRSIIHGDNWLYFLLTTVGITLVTGLLALNLLEPIHKIDFAAKDPMFGAITKIFAPSYRTIGVLFVGLGMYLIVMTQIHYLSGLRLLTSNRQSGIAHTIFNRTQRFRKPWLLVAFATLSFLIAFFFINNYAYQWIS
ncbi:hypothetical protein [Kangiella sp. HZ709]|uniref:hypothetical protein n=1 Tax=Kangiella sp. HZ709 TaxID=2666328 RepID=UPI0012AF2647|nr:hypothetical protein [Kangiella sp. HZ709]MRX27280.1 hypothetical protein [Kangiella sp. HZ709]